MAEIPDVKVEVTGFPEAAFDSGLKAGIKTSEFWISVASLVIGLGLVVFGQTELQQMIGGSMLSMTTPGYAISRAITKKGK